MAIDTSLQEKMDEYNALKNAASAPPEDVAALSAMEAPVAKKAAQMPEEAETEDEEEPEKEEAKGDEEKKAPAKDEEEDKAFLEDQDKLLGEEGDMEGAPEGNPLSRFLASIGHSFGASNAAPGSMQQALDKQRGLMALGMLQQGANQVGASIGSLSGGGIQTAAPSPFEQKMAELPVQQLMLQSQMGSKEAMAELNKAKLQQLQVYNDPENPQAKTQAKLWLDKSGGKIDMTGMSLAAQDKQLQAMGRYDIGQQKINIDIGKNELKSEEQDKKRYDKLTDSLTRLESRGVTKDALAADINTQKALDMIPSDYNKMTRQDVQLLSMEVAKIATGGVPHEAAVKGLIPPTVASEIASAFQNLGNEPTGAELGAFIGKYKDYLQKLQLINQAHVGGVIDSVLANFDDLDPQKVGKIIGSKKKYLDAYYKLEGQKPASPAYASALGAMGTAQAASPAALPSRPFTRVQHNGHPLIQFQDAEGGYMDPATGQKWDKNGKEIK